MSLLYRRRTVCFTCGKVTWQPCPGHERGGLIAAWQLRPWVPRWLFHLLRRRLPVGSARRGRHR